MRNVTLAYPLGDHQPDSTIELPDDEARALVRHGRARWPEDGVTVVDEEPDFAGPEGGSPEHLGDLTLEQYQGTSSGAVLSAPGDSWSGDDDDAGPGHVFEAYDANPGICRHCGAVKPAPCYRLTESSDDGDDDPQP